MQDVFSNQPTQPEQHVPHRRGRPDRVHLALLIGGLALGALILIVALLATHLGSVPGIPGSSQPTTPATVTTIVWQVSTAAFTREEQQAIESALKQVASSKAAGAANQSQVDIIFAERQGDWAVLDIQGRKGSSQSPVGSEPLLVIAHKQGANWLLSIPASPNFCTEIKQAPGALLDKTYFIGCR